jgi:hypothetical protein
MTNTGEEEGEGGWNTMTGHLYRCAWWPRQPGAEPASIVLASTVLATNSGCEVPRAAGDSYELAGARPPAARPPAKPNFAKLFAMPAAMVPITAAVAPDTGRPYVKTFVKPVTRAPFKAGPPASVTIGFGARPPAKPNFVESGPLLAGDCSRPDCSRPVASVFGARPPAKPNYANCDPPLSLQTAVYLLPLPSIKLLAISTITSRILKLRCCVVWMDV